MKKILLITLASLGAAVAGAQQAGPQTNPGRLLASNCFQCHGTDGRGDGTFERLAGKSASEIYNELREMKAENKRGEIGWISASLFSTLPYMLSGAIPGFIDALFESVSGFTTTGGSILAVIEDQSQGILLWRSLTQWLGGMGIVMLFVALLPLLGSAPPGWQKLNGRVEHRKID